MTDKKIPKFRSTSRLVMWVRKNWHSTRLSPDREAVFFKLHQKNPFLAARHLAEYASIVGKVDEDLEKLLSGESLLKYIKVVYKNEQEVNPALVRSLKAKGASNLLFSWAQHTKKRLEEDIENGLDDGTANCPRWCYRYAKDVLCGRLPEHLENVFSKYDDAYHASKYAFDVIRGFAPCRLPDDIHTYMVMKSFEDPENEYIKTYMDASESNPDLIGNSARFT